MDGSIDGSASGSLGFDLPGQQPVVEPAKAHLSIAVEQSGGLCEAVRFEPQFLPGRLGHMTKESFDAAVREINAAIRSSSCFSLGCVTNKSKAAATCLELSQRHAEQNVHFYLHTTVRMRIMHTGNGPQAHREERLTLVVQYSGL